MKKTAIVLAALMVGSVAQAQTSAPQAAELSVSVDFTYVSDYVFRGMSLAGASYQPSVEASYADFYAGVWASNEISGSAPTEADFYVGYGLKLTDTISVDAGVTRFTYDGGGSDDRTEVYVGLSFDTLLSPSVYYYYDFDNEAQFYVASVGYSLPLEAIGTSLDFSGSFGVVKSDLIGVGRENFSYGSVGVAVPYALSETATLTAGVQYLLSDSNNFNSNHRKDIVVGSVGITVGF